MDYQKVLKKVQAQKIDPQTAFMELYTVEETLPRAHFVKIKIKILESKGATFLANLFFALPCPIFVVNWFLKFAKKNIGEENYEIARDIITHAKGTVITVDSSEAKIYLKVI